MDLEFGKLASAHAPAALVACDASGTVLFWNPAAERLFGWDAGDALGRQLAELIVPPEQRADDDQLRLEAVAGLAERHEVMRRRRDGTPVVVNIGMRAVPGAAPSCLLGQFSDATRYRARRDAALVTARFGLVLENAPDAVVLVNASGRIVSFNAQARAMFGHDAASVIGEPIEILLPGRLRQGHLTDRMGYIDRPRVRAMGEGRELHGLRASGDEFPVEISLSPIDTEAGRLVMSVIRDIGERRNFERTLREKNVELERASRAKDLFLATMSHELRTPLNAIIGFTGLLLMKLPGPLTPDQEKQLGLVQASGRHLLSLINDLLDLTRIESGRVELHLEAVDGGALLDEVRRTLAPAAASKGLALRAETGEALPAVRADRRALQQILINLANNAIKFTATGGVTLRAQAVPDGVALVVEDTGVGISTEDQARLFQAFTQVGDRRQRKAEGTGLGLHLSGKLAELMGTHIHLDSEPGRGSRFGLTLPLAD